MRLVWEANSERRELSTVAEEFFRKLAARMGGAMLLTKGELHRLGPLAPTAGLSSEITQKLDCLAVLFAVVQMRDETVTSGDADVGTLASGPGNDLLDSISESGVRFVGVACRTLVLP